MHYFGKMWSASGSEALPLDPAGEFRPLDPFIAHPGKNPAGERP